MYSSKAAFIKMKKDCSSLISYFAIQDLSLHDLYWCRGKNEVKPLWNKQLLEQYIFRFGNDLFTMHSLQNNQKLIRNVIIDSEL